MPIQVTCPSCLKRFQVSEKFAGKTGPCPNCKTQIRVPDKSEEVVIHAPVDDAPKTRTGESVLKPIKRTETKVTRKGLILSIGSVVAAIVTAIVLRFAFDPVPLAIKVAAALLLAPPLVWAAYAFVRESELEPYRGSELRNRVLIGSGILSALWLVYAFVPTYLFDLNHPAEMSFIVFGVMIATMLAIGGFVSSTVFELEYFSGLIHAGVYVLATLLLAVIAGIPLANVAIQTAAGR
jgi:cation transport ATPase